MQTMEQCFDPFPRLETERTWLRPITREDLEDMYAYCSIPVVSQFTTWDAHQSREDTRGFIDFIQNQYETRKMGPWGIEHKGSGNLIGSCNYVNCNQSQLIAELGYVLSPSYWNKGIMSEVIRRVIRFGFEEMGLERIEAKCMAENIGSARVMEKSGMAYEGTLRSCMQVKDQRLDLKLYAIIRGDFESGCSDS